MKQAQALILSLALCMIISCSRKAVPTVITEVRDTTIIKEVPRYIEVKIPGDTVEVVKLLECDSNKIKPVAIKKKSGHATVLVSIDNKGMLTATATCDSLNKVIEAKDREITTLRKETRKETIVVTEFKTRRIDYLCRWISGVVALTLAGYVGWKTIKPKFL